MLPAVRLKPAWVRAAQRRPGGCVERAGGGAALAQDARADALHGRTELSSQAGP